ncbi:MAG: T9SS type A sorting domain-containing protein [Ignavibacteria bacterium]|nr:T9SS type A sorting domain-containing protein [Ignavibacteria bacterium]
MWKSLLIILFFPLFVFSQQNSGENFIGVTEQLVNENGVQNIYTTITPEINNGKQTLYEQTPNNPPFISDNNTTIRWLYTDPVSVGNHCAVSSNGNYNITAWDLNSKRVSFYGNLNSTPLWEYYVDPQVSTSSYVAISDTGGVIAVGSTKNIYLFNNSSSTPFFNLNLSTIPYAGTAGPVDITKDGSFFVGCEYGTDSSTIYGFNSSSTTPVWSFKVIPSTGAARVYGINISGNDSLLIANTYGVFYVLNTYTGQLIYEGLINPSSSSGTQAVQGISGDGNIIATVNYRGYVRVFQRSGSTYNLLWQHQEPPGSYYNWMYSVDISYNGDFIACGTLNFLSSSSYDGKVKVFKTASGGTPLWTYTGCGDNVVCVSLSKSGNILAAASYGALSHTTNDFYLFKTFTGNTPIFTINTPGSLYWCSTSHDGKTVVTSGKAVHARIMGNGGLLYNISVDTLLTSISNNQSLNPTDYKLSQNYPNPFNPKTVIKYVLPERGYIGLKVFNVMGENIATLVNRTQDKGNYEVTFNGESLPSGIYFYRLEANGKTINKKMILLK